METCLEKGATDQELNGGIWSHALRMQQGLTYVLQSLTEKQDPDTHKSFRTAHALCFLSTRERVGSTNNSWAETISVTKATWEKTKSFKNFLFQWLICLIKKRIIKKNPKPKKSFGSTEFSAFHSCLIFSPRSNCHGKWKSHHLLMVLLDHILLVFQKICFTKMHRLESVQRTWLLRTPQAEVSILVSSDVKFFLLTD